MSYLQPYVRQLRPRTENYIPPVDKIQDLLITETVGEKGLAYEIKVHQAIKSAKIPKLFGGDKPGRGFSNVGAGDIEATYQGDPFNVEVKLSANDQMGGGSFRYDFSTKIFIPVPDKKTGEIKFDPDDLELMLKVAKEMTSKIDDYIKAARKIEPVNFHKDISGIPIKVSTDARDELKSKKFLSAINRNIKATTKFIINHYNKKGVYYIQVGGAGLFYMGKNPFKLPVPELSGEINIEFRLGFGGGKLFFNTEPEKTPARSAGLRLQGRLKTKGKSKYSLDNVADIEELFGVK